MVNTVVGFIGPEYLFNGKQITRAGLEDHFCGKLMGVPMGVDVCYTNHAEADQDDADTLLALLVASGVNFVMGVPGADDVMLGYQTTATPLHRPNRAPQRAPDDDRLWTDLRQLTPARIGLRRAGASLATGPLLDLRLAHARARDAVHEPLDDARLIAELAGLGLPVVAVASAVEDRQHYLMRPDLGRRLAPGAEVTFAQHANGYDVVLVVTDGLSARATQRHAEPVLACVLPALHAEGWRVAPLVVVRQGRVAVGDAIAGALHADCVVVLIGERPGLSAPDSMGAYLTWQPSPQTTDADRNCISNIRPEGIGYADAAFKLAYMLRAMCRRRLSGVRLKEDSDRLLIGGH